MARFHPDEQRDGRPAWLTFVREVNGVAPDTFGKPDVQEGKPAPGYVTEVYPGARIVRAPQGSDEGVRVVATTEPVAAAFRAVADRWGIHLARP